MKNLTRFALILATASLAITPAGAQDEAQPAETTILPWQRAFENLELDTKTKLAEMLANANRLYRQKRIFECLNALSEAEALFDELPDLHNLKGACYVEFRDFERARKEFDQALELSPGNADILFNLAELSFVTHQWPAAERKFEEVKALVPEANIPMHRIIDYKLLLTKMKLEKEDEVQTLAYKHDHTDDTPYHYYAEAALAFRAGDTDAAEGWVRRAQRVFQKPEVLSPWIDTLVEFGYIKSFYGGDLEEGAN